MELFLVATMGACLLMGCPAALVAQTTVQPEAREQTTPVPHSGDAADDPAVWIHPQEPGLSLILGTDKEGGLHSYNMDGSAHQLVSDGSKPNNMDVLIASSQRNNTYKVYERSGENRYVLTIDPKEGQIDDVSDTDGICVTSCPTSAQFAQGVLIVQDGTNAGGNQNFKLYGWEDVAGTNLLIETGCQPRGATAGPRLIIQHAGNNVLVLLPRPITGYRLQEKNDLAAGNWSDVGAFSNQVTETLSAPTRFYRLILNSGVEAE